MSRKPFLCYGSTGFSESIFIERLPKKSEMIRGLDSSYFMTDSDRRESENLERLREEMKVKTKTTLKEFRDRQKALSAART